MGTKTMQDSLLQKGKEVPCGFKGNIDFILGVNSKAQNPFFRPEGYRDHKTVEGEKMK